eukprot:TRINITY_DN77841_c0_g1_i1.p2 TRINITY_DN77841_c0_g1~~TRINITY_DN77841_c0_g1_i1.p2  ORF type:complete len:155 (-),score=33.54 TRINITY_DN77841_c0_g1_i1:105-569(-)
MAAWCKPLRCLSFLGGKKPPVEYSQLDQSVGRAVDLDDADDDFFTDSWGADLGTGSASAPSQAEAQRSGVERNPTRETTTKRAGASPGTVGQGTAAAPKPKKQDADFFNELGMEPEYKAPRVLEKDGAKASVSSMLDDAVEVSGAGWGNDDLDL